MKKKIQSIQFLRCCSAIVVLFCHYFDGLNTRLTFYGRFGVAFFFLISGFLIAGTTLQGMRNYWKNKIIRIVPLYWATTVLVFFVGIIKPGLLNTSTPTIETLLKSLFFIPYWTEGQRSIYPLYPIAWTLLCEMFVYFLFWLSMKIVKKQRLAVMICAIVISSIVATRYLFSVDNLFTAAYGKVYMIYFPIGMLIRILSDIFYDYAQRQNAGVEWNCPLCTIIIIGFVYLSQFYSESSICILLCSLIFGVFVTVLRDMKFPVAFINLGNISYSFYLAHYFIVKFYSRIVLKYIGMNQFTIWAGVILCLALTIMVAKVLFDLFEVKCSHKMRGMLDRVWK